MNSAETIPLVILGGSDRKATELPEQARESSPVVGFKGVDLKIDGKPMVTKLIEILRSFGQFDPIWIAGPPAVYRDAGVDQPIIETNGGFGENLQTAIEWVQSKLPDKPLGFITCDILPTYDDLKKVMENYHSHAPYGLWGPLIRAPDDPALLGAFGWKPKYQIKPSEGEAPFNILPGHFAIIDPPGLRLKFCYDLFGIAYKTRNRSIATRRALMVKNLLMGIVIQDFKKLFRGRNPNLTRSIVGAGLRAAKKLRSGEITRSELESALKDMFVKTDYRTQYPHQAISLPLLDALSFARDIDTYEEARATGVKTADTMLQD